jgi:hypothetical protein
MWAIQTCVSCFWPAPSSCIKDCTPQRCSRPLSDDRQLPRARVADCAHDLQPTRGDELRAHGRLVHELILALPHPLLRREGSGGSARPHPLPRLTLATPLSACSARATSSARPFTTRLTTRLVTPYYTPLAACSARVRSSASELAGSLTASTRDIAGKMASTVARTA